MIGRTVSHYKILEKLGEGGMGVVYKAQDLKLDRVVALKFLPEKLVADAVEKERFIHEAKAASALNHPNVTTIHEIDEHDGQLFIVMEYCPGQSVKELIEGEQLTLKKTLDIAVQICEGLTAAHKKDVVHRDIKSDNIMVTPEGRVKIMDFGLAKLKGATKLTTSGSTLGTVAYMSPEQAQAMEVDQRSDIFSFGVVFYEMITGHLPFGGDHEAAVIYSIVNETPEPLARYKADAPEGLQRIVEKALTKDCQERYQHIDGVLADLRHEKRTMEYATAGRIPSEVKTPRSKRSRLPVIVTTAVIALAVVLFFIFKPFEVKIGPQPEAIAQENSLAIMYFENVADPQDSDRYARMITSLLITDLSESQYLRVVSRQRLYDILKAMGKEDLKVIDQTVASEVAEKAGARWILTGDILQTEPNILLTADISDATTGRVLATQRVTGETGEDLFTVVDKLSAEIKGDLSLPEQAQSEPDRSVADVTTHSPEAYRYYTEGVDFVDKAYYAEAEESFYRALEYDSTFAMAYYQIATITMSDEEARRMAGRAWKYSDKVSRRERNYIRSFNALLSRNYTEAVSELKAIVERYPDDKFAYFWLGLIHSAFLSEYDQAISYFQKAIEIDSLYKFAYNVLAYTYNDLGDFERSLWAINKYISLAPDEANPYDSRGDLYALNGKIDQAIESYRKALEIKPDFYMSRRKMGTLYVFKQDYQQAEDCYKVLTSCADKYVRSAGRTRLAYIPLYQGKFTQALTVLDQGLAADRMEQVEFGQIEKYYLKSRIYRQQGKIRSALAELEQAVDISSTEMPDFVHQLRNVYVELLTENGDLKKAKDVIEQWDAEIAEGDTYAREFYWYARGSIELARDDPQAALSLYRKSAGFPDPFYLRYTLGKTYLKAGHLARAVEAFEKAISRYHNYRALDAIASVKTYYYLGQIYERSDWTDKALEQYETFLGIWKDADEGIEEVEQARERVAALKMAAAE